MLFIIAMQSMTNKFITAGQPPVIVRGNTIAACKLVVAITVTVPMLAQTYTTAPELVAVNRGSTARCTRKPLWYL